MRSALALLLLLGSASAFAAESLERRAPATAGRSCALSYASLEDAIAARRLAEKPVYDKTARIRARYAEFNGIRSADNRAYLEIAEAANRGGATKAKFFFDVENAVLKDLNDKVVKDKDLVTALTNLHKDVLWNVVQADPLLKPHLVAKYSDFKSIRLAFDSADPAIEARLREKLAAVAARYKNYLNDVAAKEGWDERSRGLARDAQNWFHGGTGSSPDLAGLSAKCSRSQLGAGGLAQLRGFADCLPRLERSVRQARAYQGWAEKRFRNVDGFLVDDGGGRQVLSAEAIEALKKVSPKAEGADAFFAAIQEAVKDRFGASISPKEARALSDYLTRADQFSPGLMQAERVVVDMGKEALGVVSVDFKGQNARNLEETMKALSRTEGKPLVEKVKAVRAGEELATKRLDAQKARLQRVFDKVFPGLRGEFTGDDGTGFFTARMPSPAEEEKIARAWVEEGGGVADIRLTFQDFRGAPLSARSNMVVIAEGLEKELRKELIRTLPRETLNGLQISVSLKGHADPTVVIRLLGKGKPSAALAAEVKRIAEGKGVRVEAVTFRALR
jgi:hypothetical protein